MVLSDEEKKRRIRERGKKYQQKNPEKTREHSKKWRNENPEKAREANRKWRKNNPEKVLQAVRNWQKKNPDLVQTYSKRSQEKNPQANTKLMTKYRRSHRECEWSYCEQIKSLHVHHILSQKKYPEYLDGNYHGQIANNFICYCPFHHFAYHYAYSTNRNDMKHQNALGLLWFRVEQWADDNKIPSEDLKTEVAQMLPLQK